MVDLFQISWQNGRFNGGSNQPGREVGREGGVDIVRIINLSHVTLHEISYFVIVRTIPVIPAIHSNCNASFIYIQVIGLNYLLL